MSDEDSGKNGKEARGKGLKDKQVEEDAPKTNKNRYGQEEVEEVQSIFLDVIRSLFRRPAASHFYVIFSQL